MKNKILIHRRKELGFSQQEVAEIIGIDRSYYTKIENGFIPSVKVAKALGRHLNLDWTIFFDDKCVKNAQDNNRNKEVS